MHTLHLFPSHDDKLIPFTELVLKAKEQIDKVSSDSSDCSPLHFLTVGRISKLVFRISGRSPTKRTPTTHRSPPKEQPEPVPQIQPTADDTDPCFEISIIGPEPNQSARFKTRGKYPVCKVLQAACRTFGMDYNLWGLSLPFIIRFVPCEIMLTFDGKVPSYACCLDWRWR